MRLLNMNEVEAVAGASDADLLLAGLVVGGIVGLSASYPTYGYYPPVVVYEPVTTYYDVSTPMYDKYGFYVGDMVVDTYSYTDYVPVYY